MPINSKKEFKLGKVFSIEIDASFSWLIILLLVWFSFTFGFYPITYPNFSIITNLILGIISAILFFSSIVFHELAHSIIAKRQGLEIKKITLFLFGGVAQIKSEPKTALSELKMASAGPLSSILLSAFFWFIFFITENQLQLPPTITAPFSLLAQINLVLGLFNLAPGFPLDGGRIFRSILWIYNNDYLLSTRISVFSGRLLAYLLMIFGFLQTFLGNFGGLWLIMLGLFLEQAALASLFETETEHQLESVHVETIMNENPVIVSEKTSTEEITKDLFKKTDTQSALVKDESGHIVGFIDLDSIERMRAAGVDSIDEYISKYEIADYLHKEDSAATALKRMEEKNEAILPVVEEDEIIGSISKESLIGYLRLKRA